MEDMNQSNSGKIIMEGYLRYLTPELFKDFNLLELIEKIRVQPNIWFHLSESDSNLKICFLELEGQYITNLDDRYQYLGCICFYHHDNLKSYRMPLYKDKNSNFCIPSMRKIYKFYFNMLNLNPSKKYYLNYHIKKQELYFIIDEGSEFIQYELSEKGITFYKSFPEYLNSEYFDSVKALENKLIH